MKVIITAGGTGGHIYPALSIVNKIKEMETHAKIILNHKTKFNTFDKPLQNYKWIEINDKILIFTIDPVKKEIHLCEYMPRTEVFY